MIEGQVYSFENVEVDLARGCVLRDGEERHLRQKAFQVLVFLLENHGRLVSKDELFENVWTGVAVTDDVLVQCIKEVRRAIGDDTRNARFVKTVPKVGYRFIGDVARRSISSIATESTHVEIEYEESESVSHASVDRPALPASSSWFQLRYLIPGLLAVFAVVAAVAYTYGPGRSRAESGVKDRTDGRKTVAVMSIENASGSAEIDWLREGLADMLVAGLSRSDRLTLIDRGRLTELGDNLKKEIGLDDAATIARSAKADVFIRGSFAQIGEHLRLDLNVYDAASGGLLRSETLTVEKVEAILSEIDLVSLRIAAAISPAAQGSDQRLAAVMTDDLEAYRYYSMGVEKAHAFENKTAVELLEKAVELDPDFAMAQARIGYTYALTWGQVDVGKPYLEKAFRQSSRLTERDRMNIAAWYAIANRDYDAGIAAYREIIDRFPLDAEAYWRLGLLLTGEERNQEALDVLKTGIAVDPRSKVLFNALGILLSGESRHAEAIAAHERYVALSPNEPNAYDSLGLTLQRAGEYTRAIENFNKAIALKPDFEVGLIHLANVHIRQGQYNAAIDVLKRYVAAAPSGSEAARGSETIAYVYLKKGDLSSAAKYIETMRRQDAERAWVAYMLAVEQKQVRRATELETGIRARANGGGRGARLSARLNHYFYGFFALNNGRPDEAIQEFTEAVHHPPPTWNYSDYEECLGTALLTLGRYDEAIAEFQRTLSVSPHYPLAQYYLAKAYQGKGMDAEARQAFAAFLDDWKNADADVPEVIEARKYTGASAV